MIASKGSIGNCQWLPFVFLCIMLNTAKYVVCFYNCWKLSLRVFYTRGVCRGFDGFAEKAPVVRFLLNKVLRRDSGPGGFFFFSWILQYFWSTCLVEHERMLLYCFWTTVIINILSSICRAKGMQVCFFLRDSFTFIICFWRY